MAVRKTSRASAPGGAKATTIAPTADRVAEATAWLERKGTKKNRDRMARYGIVVVRGADADRVRGRGRTDEG